LPVIAALFCAGEVEMVAQRIEQGCPRREFELPLDTVYGQRYCKLVWSRDDSLASLRRVRSRHMHLRMSRDGSHANAQQPDPIRNAVPEALFAAFAAPGSWRSAEESDGHRPSAAEMIEKFAAMVLERRAMPG